MESISQDNEMYVVDVNGIGTIKSNFISWDDFLDNTIMTLHKRNEISARY